MSTTTKEPSKRAYKWRIWGTHPDYGDGQPIKLFGHATYAECYRQLCTRQQEGGWTDLLIEPDPHA